MKKLFILLIVIISSVTLFNPDENREELVKNSALTSSSLEEGKYLVTKVVDGDTVKLNINGNEKTIRLIGIDTPETVHPNKPVECFGTEASNKAKDLLTNKRVGLEIDNSQGESDRYGRLLGYIILPNGDNFNQLMIEEGYAYEYTYNTPYKYQGEFESAEKEARENERGLWNPNVCKENFLETKTEKEQFIAPISIPIQKEEPKKIEVEIEEKDCHPNYSGCLNPNASDYDCAGGSGNGPYYTGKVRVLGADVFRLDRDKDGWGCE